MYLNSVVSISGSCEVEVKFGLFIQFTDRKQTFLCSTYVCIHKEWILWNLSLVIRTN